MANSKIFEIEIINDSNSILEAEFKYSRTSVIRGPINREFD